jgi:hypothetical protein
MITNDDSCRVLAVMNIYHGHGSGLSDIGLLPHLTSKSLIYCAITSGFGQMSFLWMCNNVVFLFMFFYNSN